MLDAQITELERAIKNICSERTYFNLSEGQSLLQKVKPKFTGDEKREQLSPTLLQSLDGLVANQISWARDALGVVLSNPTPDKNKIFVYDAGEWEKLRVRLKKSSGWDASHDNCSGEIVVCKQDLSKLICTLNHELVHHFSYQRFYMETKVDKISFNPEDNNVTIYSYNQITSTHYGYLHQGNFAGLNEVITELINLELLSKYCKQTKTDFLKDYNLGYPFGVILFDLLIKKVAEQQDINPAALRKELYLGYYNGNTERLKLIRKSKRDSLKLLSDCLPGDFFSPTSPKCDVIAKKYCIEDKYKNKLEIFQAGKIVVLF